MIRKAAHKVRYPHTAIVLGILSAYYGALRNLTGDGAIYSAFAAGFTFAFSYGVVVVSGWVARKVRKSSPKTSPEPEPRTTSEQLEELRKSEVITPLEYREKQTISRRLVELVGLRESAVITPQEYKEKRRQILDSI